jgi:hypothetical protein
LDVILGRAASISHVVGGWMDDRAPGPDLHTIELGRVNDLITADIRLFANLGASSYLVVVGRARSHRM